MFHHWRCGNVLAHHVRDQRIASGAVMYISEDEVFQIPAARLKPRALVLGGEESREHRNEAFTPTFAPLAPNAHLPGIHSVVNELCGIGIDDNADWNISLSQLLPKESHFRFFLGDAALKPKRCVSRLKWIGFGNLSIGPCRLLIVELIAVVSPVKVIEPELDKEPFQELEDVVGKQITLADSHPQF